MKATLRLLILCGCLSASLAQAQYITGTSSTFVTYSHTYTFNRNNTIYMSVTWLPQNGTVLNSYSSGYNYYATILWNSPGSPNTLTVRDNGTSTNVGSMNVTVVSLCQIPVLPSHKTAVQLRSRVQQTHRLVLTGIGKQHPMAKALHWDRLHRSREQRQVPSICRPGGGHQAHGVQAHRRFLHSRS